VEYFIVANSFAAPFVSDTSEGFEEADSPQEALELYASRYSHPARLFSADCFESATAYHKNQKPLARWLCNHEIARQAATKGKGSYSYEGLRPGMFKIDGELVIANEPFNGSLVPVPD
jgi:hypothetical protein